MLVGIGTFVFKRLYYAIFLSFYFFPYFIIHIGEAESGLERLHQCAEKELQPYIDAKGPSEDFNEFRTKLAGLTRYFPNIQNKLIN